jgi:hypothetical protein
VQGRILAESASRTFGVKRSDWSSEPIYLGRAIFKGRVIIETMVSMARHSFISGTVKHTKDVSWSDIEVQTRMGAGDVIRLEPGLSGLV